MCNTSCLTFGRTHLRREEIEGKSVVEVGAKDVNGSLRVVIETLNPAKYVGVDIEAGLGVDEICDINDLVARYGTESFDVVISTEILEHVRNWRRAVSNLKGVLKPGGVLLITTRSIGFEYHGYPFDFWRYEPDDMRTLFSEFSIEAVERDPEAPGVFVKAHKPLLFRERDLRAHELYSVIKLRRCRDVRETDVLFFRLKQTARRIVSRILPAELKARIKNVLEHKGTSR